MVDRSSVDHIETSRLDLESTDTEIKMLKPKYVAEALGVSLDCLLKWRREGKGPPWFRLGERLIRYERESFEHWLEQRKEQAIADGTGS